MIPLSDAIRATGGADLVASGMAVALQDMPPLLTLAAVMAMAMAATPFLNNAATVLVMAPVILVFFFAQKAFVEGVTLTGVKG